MIWIAVTIIQCVLAASNSADENNSVCHAKHLCFCDQRNAMADYCGHAISHVLHLTNTYDYMLHSFPYNHTIIRCRVDCFVIDTYNTNALMDGISVHSHQPISYDGLLQISPALKLMNFNCIHVDVQAKDNTQPEWSVLATLLNNFRFIETLKISGPGRHLTFLYDGLTAFTEADFDHLNTVELSYVYVRHDIFRYLCQMHVRTVVLNHCSIELPHSAIQSSNTLMFSKSIKCFHIDSCYFRLFVMYDYTDIIREHFMFTASNSVYHRLYDLQGFPLYTIRNGTIYDLYMVKEGHCCQNDLYGISQKIAYVVPGCNTRLFLCTKCVSYTACLGYKFEVCSVWDIIITSTEQRSPDLSFLSGCTSLNELRATHCNTAFAFCFSEPLQCRYLRSLSIRLNDQAVESIIPKNVSLEYLEVHLSSVGGRTLLQGINVSRIKHLYIRTDKRMDGPVLSPQLSHTFASLKHLALILPKMNIVASYIGFLADEGVSRRLISLHLICKSVSPILAQIIGRMVHLEVLELCIEDNMALVLDVIHLNATFSSPLKMLCLDYNLSKEETDFVCNHRCLRKLVILDTAIHSFFPQNTDGRTLSVSTTIILRSRQFIDHADLSMLTNIKELVIGDADQCSEVVCLLSKDENASVLSQSLTKITIMDISGAATSMFPVLAQYCQLRQIRLVYKTMLTDFGRLRIKRDFHHFFAEKTNNTELCVMCRQYRPYCLLPSHQ